MISGSGRSPGGGNGNPLQHSGLENPTDRGAWPAAVHGVAVITTEHAHTEHKDVKGLPFFPVPHPALGTNKTRKHVYKLTFSEVLTLAKV